MNKLVLTLYLLVCTSVVNSQPSPQAQAPAAPQPSSPQQNKPQPSTQRLGIKETILEQKAKESGRAYYTSPGIIGFRQDRWIGSDHLFNLSEDLGVIVEIITQPHAQIPLNQQHIENILLQTLGKGGLRPFLLTGGDIVPVPYLHLLIMSMPMPGGDIAFVSLRLFEQVNLKRVQLAPGIHWQGITWEKQTLVEASTQDFIPHVNKDIEELATEFVERYKHFEDLRKKFGPRRPGERDSSSQ